MTTETELKWLLTFFGRELNEQWSQLPTNFTRYWLDVGLSEVEVHSPQLCLVIIFSEHLDNVPDHFNLSQDCQALAPLDELRVLLDWFVLGTPNTFIFFAPPDDLPSELFLIWRTIGRLCNLILADPEVQNIPVQNLDFNYFLNTYASPLAPIDPRK